MTTEASALPRAASLSRLIVWLLGVAVFCAFVTLPFFLDNYMLRLATTLMMYIVLAWSWNFIGGFVGYPSFGIAAFFGLGAYTGAILLTNKIAPLWVSPLAGALLSGLVAAIIGAPILRLRGHYFAVASLGVSEAFREVAMSWTDVTGGGMGLNLPPPKATFVSGPIAFYFAMFAVALACLAVTLYVASSRLGVAFRCIRQNEQAANMIGINATRAKIIAFGLSAAFPGAVGALYASWVGYIDPSDVFDILISVKAPVMVLLGGVGTVLGPAAGAFLFMAFDELVWRSFLEFHSAILGLIVVFLVLFMPDGLVELARRAKQKKGG
jgi:branched-chain amino acid transport system permease protein